MLDLLIARRRTVVSAFLLVLVVLGSGIARLEIDPNNRVFFSTAHPKFAELLRLEEMFGSNTELLFVVASEHGFEESLEFRQAVEWLTERAWSLDAVQSVQSLSSYPFVMADHDDFSVVDSIDYACGEYGPCDAKRLAEIVPLHIENRLVARERNALAVVAKVRLGEPLGLGVLEIARQANELKQRAAMEFPGLEFLLTGGVPMMEAFFSAAARDSAILMPVVLVVLFFALTIFLGSSLYALVLTLVGLSSVVLTLGIAGWIGLTLNTATAMAPLVIFTLVIASSMHLFMHIAADVGGGRSDGVASSIKTSVRSNLVPIVLTATTTCIGFSSMIFVSSPPIRELGILAAIGVAIGAALSLVVVPAVFSMLPRLGRGRGALWLQRTMNKYAKWMEQTQPSALVFIVVLIASLFGISRISFDEDFVRYFSEDTRFRQDTERISSLLTGPYHIDVVLDTGEPGGVFSPEAILLLDELEQFLRLDRRVVNVASVADVLKQVSGAFSSSSELGRFTADELAQFFLIYELSLSRGETTLDFVDSGSRNSRVSVLLRDVSMAEIRDLVEEIELWGATHAQRFRLRVSGEGVPTAYLSGESIAEMSYGVVVSMLMSAVLVGALLRSAKVSGVVFLATVVPLIAGFGLWGWFDGKIGMAATLVIATTIGVVIDDTIHLAYRYLDGRSNLELTSWGASAYSVHKTGPALVATTVGLGLGFLVLLLSQFEMNRTFGLCSTLVICVALIYNLTVSPRLLRAIS